MKRFISTLAAAGLALAIAAPALAQTIEEVERCIGGAGAQRFSDPFVVRFDTDSTDIKAEFMGRMDEATKTIKGQKPMTVCLIGSTDKTGSVEYNRKLAIRRAHAVGNKLVEMGVEARVLKVITDTKTSEQELISKVIGKDRPAERRVTILLAK